MKKLFRLYNSLGLTSIADRDAGRDSLDIYLSLHSSHELTVRINVARSFDQRHPRGSGAEAGGVAGTASFGRFAFRFPGLNLSAFVPTEP